MTKEKRRQYGTGAVYQVHDHPTCPPLQHVESCPEPDADGNRPRHTCQGARPEHTCQGRWKGAVMTGWNDRLKRDRRIVSGRTEPEVKRKIAKLQEQLNDGPTEASQRTTVKAWGEQWLSITARRLRPKTLADNTTAVRKWIVPTIGHRRLGDLTPSDVRRVGAAIVAADNTTSTARRTHMVLRKMLKDAIADGYPVPTRLLQIGPPAKSVNDRAAIPTIEAVKLLVTAGQYPDHSRWAAALLQGMRQAECLGLTWDCVDLDAGTIDVSWQLQRLPYVSGRAGKLRVPDGYEYRLVHGALALVRPKTAAGQRIVPLVPWMHAALEDWRRTAPHSPAGLVWPRPDGRPRDPQDDRDEWAAMQSDAELGHPTGRWYHVHEARHATATLLMALGVDESVRVAIMGHSSIAVTRQYQHSDLTLVRGALEAAAGRLGLTLPAAIEPAPSPVAAGAPS